MKFWLKPIVLLLGIVNLVLIALVIWRINLGSYNNPFTYMSEQISERIDTANLTAKHGDELLEAVERYESLYTLSRDFDSEELARYATGQELKWLLERVDRNEKSEYQKRCNINPDSIKVVSYTENEAILTGYNTCYTLNGQESLTKDGGGKVIYDLRFEDEVWKISDMGYCGLDDCR